MSISKNLKKILVASAALVMALSAGAGVSNVQASAHRRYHYRYARKAKRYHAKRHYRSRRRARKHYRKPVRRRARKHIRRRHKRHAYKPVHHKITKLDRENGIYNDAQFNAIRQAISEGTKQDEREDKAESNHIKRNLPKMYRTMRQRDLQDLNQDRATKGEGPLTEDPTLDRVAQKRAWQLDHVGFTHDDANGNGYASEMDPDVSAENIAYESHPYQDPVSETKSTTDDLNNNLFYKEEPYDGGHYENILHGGNRVGIGAYYNNGSSYLAEDFGD